MPELTPERWLSLTPHLEQALDLAPAERAAFVAQLGASDSTLAADLAALLDEHAAVERRGFLADPIDGAALGVAEPLAGMHVGAYTLDAPIGRGGMGAVWRAHRHDGRFDAVVAVKLLNPALVDAAGVERFRREGSILARLTHPGIARLLDAGITDAGQPYLVLEFVEGTPIDASADARRLDVPARLALMTQVLDAVAHAHANLVVHRDLKPSNILVRDDGAVKLLDFGIAMLVEPDGGPRAGQPTVAMTPEYAAPEQVAGQLVTTRTDVYALGVVLYRLLTGRHPHEVALGSPVDLFRAIADQVPARASQAAPLERRRALAGDLDAIVARALRKAPDERYDSVGAMADDLRRCLAGEPVQSRAGDSLYRTRKWVARNRALTAVAAVAVVGTLGGLVAAVSQGREATRQRDAALRALERSEAVTAFYNFLISDAGPADEPITIKALIERSDLLLTTEFADNRELQAPILVLQASYYLGLGELKEAEARSDRAIALLTNSDDMDARATAACIRGSVAAEAGRFDEGIRLIDEALALPGITALSAVDCHAKRSYIARNARDGATAERHTRAALEGFAQLPRRSPRTEAILQSDLGFAHQVQGRLADADTWFRAAMATMTRIGQDRSPSAVTILNNWGIAVLYGGDVRRAREIWQRAFDAAVARDPSTPPPAYLVANLARANQQSGRFAEAKTLYEQARAVGAARGSDETVAYADNGLGTVCLDQGDLDCAERHSRSAHAITDRMPAGAAGIAISATLSGGIALARGRAAEAWDIFERLRVGYDAQSPNASAAGIRPRLADAALELGRLDEASRLAEDGIRRIRGFMGGLPWSRPLGLAQFTLARVRLAQGRTADAREAAAAAHEHLRQTLEPDHPMLARVTAFEAALPATR